MRRGFDRPTSSSVSRFSGTGARNYTQRTRQGRNDAVVQEDFISAPRESLNQPSLTLPSQPDEFQPASPGRKSPAYLEGRNPYGQILDHVEHPYRRSEATGGAPSQIGATLKSRPRTLGSFQFKTRPEPKADRKREDTTPDPSTSPSSLRSPAKPVSVRAARDFFESKASQNGSAPLLPPLHTSAATKGVVFRGGVSDKHAQSNGRDGQPAQSPNLVSRTMMQSESGLGPSMPRPPPDLPARTDRSQRTTPFARPKSDTTAPKAILRKATMPQDTATYNNHSTIDPNDTRLGRRKPTNLSETVPPDAEPFGSERQAVGDSSALDDAHNTPVIALEHVNRSDDRHTSDETVRRCLTYECMSAAKSDEGATGEARPPFRQTRRTKSSRHVRKSLVDDAESEA